MPRRDEGSEKSILTLGKILHISGAYLHSMAGSSMEHRHNKKMSTGIYLRVGDETSCGGAIIEGCSSWLINGRPIARDGDQVTCGRDGQVYNIMGGVHFTMVDGRPAAGTLDSVSSCPCEATLIPSTYDAMYTHIRQPSSIYYMQPLVAASESAAPWARAASTEVQAPIAAEPERHPDVRPEDPGFYIVRESTSHESLEAQLFDSPSADVLSKFRALNPRRGAVKAGELLVLGDPANKHCTYEETLLMEVAAQVHAQLRDVSPEVADFTAQNHAQLEGFLSYGSQIAGTSAAMLGHHIGEVEKLLKSVEQLYIKTFLLHGNLKSADFMAERKELLSKLDARLNRITRMGAGIPDHPKLKAALKISSRSLVHHWTKAGAPGQIPGYATHLDKVSKMGAYVKYGGWIGLGVGGMASITKIKEVCRTGEQETCDRVKITEAGAFAGSVVGGKVGAVAGQAAAGLICVAMGLPTAGAAIPVCIVAGVGAVALGGGILGAMGGERTSEIIYERFR